jgi:hypothetical protein
MSRPEDQIVFDDLHGMQEKEPVTVDLDADTKGTGIELSPDDQSAEVDTGNDDELHFDSLRSADVEADPQVDKEVDASSDSEDGKYSKKVKSRIQRATRATAKERQRGDYWEGQAKQLAKDSYQREKRSLEGTIEQSDSRIENTQNQLETAIEGGNTKDQVRLTSLLTDQKAAKIQAEVGLDNLSPDGNVQPFSDKVTPDGRTDTKAEADTWMEDRGDWYGARGFERQTRLANRLDKEVFADGFDPKTPEYFEELDKRIKEKEPSLYDDLDAGADDIDTDDTPRKKGKNVVAPVGGNETRQQRTNSSKVQLGPEDFATMRQFNLDPNDPAVLKEFAANKREAERGEQ